MLSSRRFFSRVTFSLLTTAVVIALAAGFVILPPTASAQSPASVSEAYPNGLRTVEDSRSEAPDLSCTDLSGADLLLANLAGADLRGC